MRSHALVIGCKEYVPRQTPHTLLPYRYRAWSRCLHPVPSAVARLRIVCRLLTRIAPLDPASMEGPLQMLCGAGLYACAIFASIRLRIFHTLIRGHSFLPT